MFKRIKNKILVWIMESLELNSIRNVLNAQNKINKETARIIEQLDNRLTTQEYVVTEFTKLIEGAVNLEVKDYHKNWAIFAIRGSGQDYVKFIDLSDLNARECREWMKRLESIGVRKEKFMYDAPMGIKDIFLSK